MVRVISIMMLLLTGFFAAPVSPTARADGQVAVSTKHRFVVDASHYPWSAVGRVNISGVANRVHCTGALIGERIVLTAAHCLYFRETGRYVAPGLVHFVAGYQRGEFIAHSTAEELIPAPRFRGENWAATSNMEHDWAFIILKEPIGLQTGYLGIQGLNQEMISEVARNEKYFYLAGYPRDRSHAISVDKFCSIDIFLQEGDLLGHSCEIVGGDSGAPIAFVTDDGLQIIALNSATNVALSNGTSTNTAVPVGKLMKKIQQLIEMTEPDAEFRPGEGRHGRPPEP